MAPARAFWKGYLKLSLISCPIALYTGTSATERVSFRQINKKTGNRLRQQLIDEVTREVVEGEDKGRGFEYAKNAYIPVDGDELDALAIESKHTIEIDSFVPREQIDERFLDTPYYITPDGQVGQDAFAVICEAMRVKDMVALGRAVLAKRERVIVLQPRHKGLMATTLRYPYEIRDAKEYFEDIPDVKVEPDMLKLAQHILQTRRRTSTPRSLWITTRKPSSLCSRRSRPACWYRASVPPRGRRMFCEPNGRAPPQHCRGKSIIHSAEERAQAD
jgi:DNA end-binding protein Ku